MGSAKSHKVELRGNLGIRDAAALAASLGAAIEAQAAVTIVADELTDVDVSILQVLAAARRTAVAAGKSLSLQAPPDGALRLALARAGFIRAGAAETPDSKFWMGSAARAKGKAA